MQRKPLLRPSRLAVLVAVCLGLAAAGCGTADPDSISVVVHMPQVPSNTASLTVQASLNGKAAMQSLQITDNTKFSRFGVRLGKDQAGTLAFTIDVYDATSCKLGTATASTSINPPLQVEITASLTLLATPQCPTPPPPADCSPAPFCWSNPTPQGNPIRGLFAISATDAWAVGDAGTALHWNGTAWSLVTTGVSDNLNAVWGSAASDVFVVGDAGRVLHWNGTAFATQTSGVTAALYGVWGSSSGNVWAVGDQGDILHYTGGNSWGPPTSVSADPLRAVWGASATEIYAVGNNGAIAKFDGSGWTKMSPPASAMTTNLFGVAGNGGTVFAVGATGTILSLSGTTWSMVAGVPTSQQLNAVWGRGASDFWAVGAAGTRLHYTGTWTDTAGGDGITSNLLSVGGAPSVVFSVGDAGTLLQYTTGPWSAVSKGSQLTVRSVYGFSAKDLWAVGANGLIMHYDGTAWTTIPVATSGANPTKNLNGVWGFKTNDLWVVGEGQQILRYSLGAWSTVAPVDTAVTDLFGVWGNDNLEIWYVAATSTAGECHIVDRVNSVELIVKVNSCVSIDAVWGTANNNVWAVGTGFLANVTKPAGMPVATGTSAPGRLRALWGSGPGDIWAAGDAGLLMRYNGAAWNPVVSGTAQQLNGIWGSGASDVWYVGNSGTVLRYDGTAIKGLTNAGGSGTHNALQSVWGAAAGDVWLGGSGGTLLHTLK